MDNNNSNRIKYQDFKIQLRKKNVLMIIDCYENSPIYEEVLQEYDILEQMAYEKIMPQALLAFGEIPEEAATEMYPSQTKAMFSFTTIGASMSQWSTKLFEEGNYLGGMLVDAMADDYLFQMDEYLRDSIIAECKIRNYGVIKRLEAPVDIPMEIQKTIWEKTRAQDELGVNIAESYMYDPVKSLAQVYILEENSCTYQMEHDCSNCEAIHCKFRQVPNDKTF